MAVSGLAGTLNSIFQASDYCGFVDGSKVITSPSTSELASALGLKQLLGSTGVKLPKIPASSAIAETIGAAGLGVMVASSAMKAAYKIEYGDEDLLNGIKRDLYEFGYDTRYIAEAFGQFMDDLINGAGESVVNGDVSNTSESISVSFSSDLYNRAKTLRKWMKDRAVSWEYDNGTINIDKSSSDAFAQSISSIYAKRGLVSTSGQVAPIAFDASQYNAIHSAKYISLFYMENLESGLWFPFIIATKVPIDHWEYALTHTTPNPVAYRGCALNLYDADNNHITATIDTTVNPRAYCYGYHGLENNSYIAVFPLNTTIYNTISHRAASSSLYSGYDWAFDTAPGGQTGSIGDVDAGMTASNYKVSALALNNSMEDKYQMELSEALNTVIDLGHDYTLVGAGATTDDYADDRDKAITGVLTGEGVKSLDKVGDIADALPDIAEGLLDLTADLPITATTPISVADLIDAIDDLLEDKFPETYIPTPSTPPSSGTAHALFTLYEVTPSDLTDLANYMWSQNVWDNIKKLFNNPIDCIISLTGYRMNINSGATTEIKLGNTGTGVYGEKINDIFQEFDMGSVKIGEYFGNFLDYSPYTKVSLYLPYIGLVNLNTEDVMNKTISVKYRVELMTGCCLAIVRVKGGTVDCEMYQYSGMAGIQLPITGANYSNVYKGVIGSVAAIGGAAAIIGTGGATAPAVAGAAGATAANVVGSKTQFQRAGSMQGNSGILGNPTPYVIIERPITDVPSGFNQLMGKVSNQYATIGSLTGFNVFDNFDVSTVDCTDDEKAEITSLLSAGIFI